jgi:hypothetical protein
MFHFLLATFFNLISGCGTGWTTADERNELEAAMKAAGKTGYAENAPRSWERHLEAMNQPQPEEWKCKDGHV